MAETTNTENVYVRQDVFNARMDRLEILIEKNGTELKAYIDNSINTLRNELKGEIQQVRSELKGEIQQVRSELKGEIQQNAASIAEVKADVQNLRAEVRVLEGRVDNAINVVYWGIGGFAVILAAAVFLPAIMGFLKKIFVPSVTLEDVERIVNAAISRHLANRAGGQTA